eukprot:CAMPEP_0201545884 /NCGR_PEP_ID=MMETSP0173_2-20130828/2303_1 /ASSEMBLY_ACC=CAM_ASM_000268 /TAXON_ID=218659 /ORGANISM="Vexillifera sp., Strain DIVA3 564/2" /LENGTH=215 /DNA_ID=CAMNT_0047954417 /DNA_START=9 /DNA_END=656 /DNA_ORIENTATION=+
MSSATFDLNSAAKSEQFDTRIKLVVVGPSAVGKSSLQLQFTDEKFYPEVELTVGVEFGVKILTLSGKRVKVQIWDTAGQESFRSLTNSYYRGSQGVLLVYDVTNRESFTAMSSWMQEIRAQADSNVVVLLVGNKSDQEENRQVPQEEAANFALHNGIGFVEVSAKTGQSVNEAFIEVCECVLSSWEKGLIVLPSTSGHPPSSPNQSNSNESSCCT